MNRFRFALFKILFPIATVIWCSWICIVGFLPLKYRQINASFWGDIVTGLFGFVCGVKTEVKGWENIPKEHAFIIMANHQSTWETAFLPRLRRFQVWILKKELTKIPIFGWALYFLKPIAIDRSKGKESLKQVNEEGKKWLAMGRSVIIFPEGTRSPVDAPQKFRMGGAILAHEAQVKILPVAHNAGQFWSHDGKFHRGTIQVVIGEPIDSVGKSASEINQMAEKWIAETREALVRAEKIKRGEINA